MAKEKRRVKQRLSSRERFAIQWPRTQHRQHLHHLPESSLVTFPSSLSHDIPSNGLDWAEALTMIKAIKNESDAEAKGSGCL